MYQSDNRGISNEAEYSTLRAEMLNSIVAVDNYKVAMYATTAAIWAVAFPLGLDVHICLERRVLRYGRRCNRGN